MPHLIFLKIFRAPGFEPRLFKDILAIFRIKYVSPTTELNRGEQSFELMKSLWFVDTETPGLRGNSEAPHGRKRKRPPWWLLLQRLLRRSPLCSKAEVRRRLKKNETREEPAACLTSFATKSTWRFLSVILSFGLFLMSFQGGKTPHEWSGGYF